MNRYFIEVSYKGTAYSGFQLQENANTVQAEMEKALNILYKGEGAADGLSLVGSSRTDAGVHALQNYFHFDVADEVEQWRGVRERGQLVYKMNAILPNDIVVEKILRVGADAHCRFDAISREYRYNIYQRKDAFRRDVAFYFPYKVNFEKMEAAAGLIKEYHDFTSFSKRRTQVKNFNCEVMESDWMRTKDGFVYYIKANRFLRGMVRALTATMLLVGRERLSLEELRLVIEAKDCRKASFAVPPQGLFLEGVNFPANYFSAGLSK